MKQKENWRKGKKWIWMKMRKITFRKERKHNKKVRENDERKLPIAFWSWLLPIGQLIMMRGAKDANKKIDNKNVSFYKSYDFVSDLLQSENNNGSFDG